MNETKTIDQPLPPTPFRLLEGDTTTATVKIKKSDQKNADGVPFPDSNTITNFRPLQQDSAPKEAAADTAADEGEDDSDMPF